MPRLTHPSRLLRKKRFRPRRRRRGGRKRVHRIEEPIDYKKVDMLRQFLNIRWSLKPRRQTRLTRQQHLEVGNAVKRARALGLLPATHLHSNFGMNPGKR